MSIFHGVLFSKIIISSAEIKPEFLGTNKKRATVFSGDYTADPTWEASYLKISF